MHPKRPSYALTCRVGNDTHFGTMHFHKFVFKASSNYPAEFIIFLRLAEVEGQPKLSKIKNEKTFRFLLEKVYIKTKKQHNLLVANH